ncbi:AfsR/SARP family transcriptional regulator [Streptomyces physcomitrii]|uniref:AAA family ATPase n=1 Tax=Streptomyces physcomitrii TaxID=2724184 RepID=A0ABX1GV57_9ACTN|nr:AfsR/SARP family transcriptional regulator [Streptomyces physcomitrii]NKI39958.1 AAA family ATPase [Streptomyces physcomitrii]
MEFRLLGPLEVEDGRGLVTLGGTRQRAALAFLLLHTNQVVPTSQLLNAMYPVDGVPLTARKILQNAVWRLRRMLGRRTGTGEAAELLTRPPGYMVRVPAEHVDLLRFQQLASRGRAALSAGDARAAGAILREALGMWRGPALADLAEEGLLWPELTALEQKRLDLTEDHFEAELVCGAHQSALRDLEAFVAAEPLRERAAQQLMLALYRSGRQADALGVYARTRAALVEGLGLEPGRQMQRLQQSILGHDPDLDLAPEPAPAAETPLWQGLPAPAPAASRAWSPTPQNQVPPAAREFTAPEPPAPHGRVTGAAGEPRESGAPAPQVQANRHSSVLMLRFGLGPEFDDLPAEDIDRALDTVCELAREEITRAGGQAAASVGSVLLGLFEPDPSRPDSADRAVRTGAAVRDCLTIPAGPLTPPAPAVGGLSVHAAVATGAEVVCHWPDARSGSCGQPWIGGETVDLCETMLLGTPPGEIHVCDETRRRTECRITYHRLPGAPAKWQVRTVPERAEGCASAADERECELALMTALLGRTASRSAAHMITVLGDSGLGRTRLLMEFQRRITAGGPDGLKVLTGAVSGSGDPLSAPAEMLAGYCGVTDQDSADGAYRKVAGSLTELTGQARGAGPDPLLAALGPLVTGGRPPRTAAETRRILAAWREFVTRAAHAQPLVLVWDDLHRAEEALLDTVEQLPGSCSGAPFLNVVGAHLALVSRRPAWSGGHQHAMTLRLTPRTGDALDQLLRDLFTPQGRPV